MQIQCMGLLAVEGPKQGFPGGEIIRHGIGNLL